MLEHYVDRTPGSFIEAKEYSLVWHYSMSDPEFGEWLANELVGSLDELPTSIDNMRPGNMFLETLRELFPKLGPKYIVDADQKNFLPFLNMSNQIGIQK